MALDAKELKAKTLDILNSVDDANNKDDVLGRMFSAGIPFAKLNTLYRTVAIEAGLIADPSVVKDGVLNHLEENSDDLESMETWADVETVIASVVEAVDGATSTVVSRNLKAFCKDSDIELPKKASKGGSRTGKISVAVIDYMNSTDEPNKQGMMDAILPCVKGPKNAFDHTNMNFTMALAIKKGITADEASKLANGMAKIGYDKAEEVATAADADEVM